MRAAHTIEDVDRELATRSLAEFIRQAWPIVEPTAELVWNWHLDAMCEHLEAVSRGEIRQLLMNVPPGSMKSLTVGVFWPAWMWIRRPEWRVNCWTHADELALRDSRKCREVLRSEWYQRNFVRGAWSFCRDQDTKHNFQNTKTGFRTAFTVGGQATGHRGDAIVVDDPLDAKDAWSKPARDAVLTAWDQGIANRLNDMQKGCRVVIMQRLHEQDLSGHLLEEGGWEHLCLPSEFETKRRSVTYVRRPAESEPVKFFEDPRTEEGALLFPARFPADVLAGEKKRLGSLGYPGQHQQRPTAAEGAMFKRSWWRFWRYSWEEPVPELADRTIIRPEKFDERALSWDCAFKSAEDNDFVAGGVWARLGAYRFLLELVWDHLSFPETLAAFKEQAEKHKKATAKYIEDAANGPAIISMVKTEIPGVIPVQPEGGKEARAAATSPLVEAGNVFIPLHAPWRDRYIEEHASFPKGSHDDAVDQQSQLLLKWGTRTRSGLDRLKAMVTM